MSAKHVNVGVFLIGLMLLTTGCLPLMIAEQAEYNAAVKRGEAPTPDILRACAQEGTVRGANGAWAYDPELERACLARAGWTMTGRNGLGQPTWTKRGDGK